MTPRDCAGVGKGLEYARIQVGGPGGRTSNGYFAFSSGSAQACSNKSAFHGR